MCSTRQSNLLPQSSSVALSLHSTQDEDENDDAEFECWLEGGRAKVNDGKNRCSNTAFCMITHKGMDFEGGSRALLYLLGIPISLKSNKILN